MVSLGLSLMPEAQFAAASLPLFEQGIIETLEWSFDMGWGRDGVPPWVDELLGHYGEAGDLVGHGVSFSVMSGEFTPHHRWWLQRLADEVQTRRYHRISEHMGFIGAGRFSFAAPLPVPFHPDIVALGQDRMRLLAETARCPVGLENLATSLGPDDGSKQGDLLDAVLDPVDGFLVLDLHNLWCQSINLGLAIDMLLSSYPLHRVAEIHVSGGSWDERSDRRIRRDTHDDLVPTEVLDLLPMAAPHCPNLETVVYERLGPSLIDPATHGPFRDDVIKVADIVANLTTGPGDQELSHE